MSDENKELLERSIKRLGGNIIVIAVATLLYWVTVPGTGWQWFGIVLEMSLVAMIVWALLRVAGKHVQVINLGIVGLGIKALGVLLALALVFPGQLSMSYDFGFFVRMIFLGIAFSYANELK